MNWLEFIEKMVGHIAWPLVIIVLLILLRKHIGVLADRIEEFSFGGAKFVWKKALQEATELKDAIEAKETKPEEKPVPKVIPGRHRTVDAAMPTNALWKATTIGSIISNYAEVEDVLFDIGDLIGIDAAAPWSVMAELRRRKLVHPYFADLFDKVRTARNSVVHGQVFVNPGDEQEYARLTAYVRAALVQLRDRLPAELKKNGPPPEPA